MYLFFQLKKQQNTYKLQDLLINIPIRATMTIIMVLIILEQQQM